MASTRTALVTGGAAGIGRATAIAFARIRVNSVIADVDQAGGDETVRMVREAGGEALFVRTDVTRSDDVTALVEKAVKVFGTVDYAFNNAGIEEEHFPLLECSEAVFDRTMNVNVKGVWLCMKAEIRQMLAQGGGAIVNTASVAGLVGAGNLSAYAGSKHAVVGLTKSVALAYSSRKIRVNAVCPAVIRTGMFERIAAQMPEVRAAAQRLHPIGRIGEPEEVAAAVLWLCSDAASFVTGHALAVDGGYVST
jgi:NAD(P)-dependent dehydrogenase (short-subunit alcohol dehydrogenase family)